MAINRFRPINIQNLDPQFQKYIETHCFEGPLSDEDGPSEHPRYKKLSTSYARV